MAIFGKYNLASVIRPEWPWHPGGVWRHRTEAEGHFGDKCKDSIEYSSTGGTEPRNMKKYN